MPPGNEEARTERSSHQAQGTAQAWLSAISAWTAMLPWGPAHQDGMTTV
jgi:hypothetical protein